MTELETERLILRPFVREDLDELARIGADPSTRGFAWQGPVDHETTAHYLRDWTGEYRRGLGHLAMIHKPDGRLIGHCGLTRRGASLVLGYALHKDYWCMGLAPEACGAVLEYGFEELELEEIHTQIPADNRAWRGMAERLGMTLQEISGTATDGEVARYAVCREKFIDKQAGTTSRRAVR